MNNGIATANSPPITASPAYVFTVPPSASRESAAAPHPPPRQRCCVSPGTGSPRSSRAGTSTTTCRAGRPERGWGVSSPLPARVQRAEQLRRFLGEQVHALSVLGPRLVTHGQGHGSVRLEVGSSLFAQVDLLNDPHAGTAFDSIPYWRFSQFCTTRVPRVFRIGDPGPANRLASARSIARAFGFFASSRRYIRSVGRTFGDLARLTLFAFVAIRNSLSR